MQTKGDLYWTALFESYSNKTVCIAICWEKFPSTIVYVINMVASMPHITLLRRLDCSHKLLLMTTFACVLMVSIIISISKWYNTTHTIIFMQHVCLKYCTQYGGR